MERFFKNAIQSETRKTIEKLVVVTHLAPGSDEFLLALHKIFPIAALIPKPTSIDQRILDIVKKHVPILNYRREQIILDPERFLTDLGHELGSSKFAIIDTGGYFSHILPELEAKYSKQLMGIVEDTENGHQKYQLFLKKSEHHKEYPYPIISVARSALKDPEDFLVGQAIAFSAEALLREQGKILNGQTAVIMGYGKIGRSIAHHLRLKSMLVKVLDINANRQVLAMAHGFQTGIKETLLSEADMIFCATGNTSLRSSDLASIKRNAYIFTATSGDDEIEGHAALVALAVREERSAFSVVQTECNRFYICNGGNAVNFVHGGIVGPYIRLVQAEMVFALNSLSNAPRHKINELDDTSKRFISESWMAQFSN